MLLLIAMLYGFWGKKNIAYGFFTSAFIIGIFWFAHHATDSLAILL